MYCKRCGTKNADNVSFCKECGAPLANSKQSGNTGEAHVRPDGAPRNNPTNSASNANNGSYMQRDVYAGANSQTYRSRQYNNTPSMGDSIPPEYTPISMWGYFGYELLFTIPLVGFILLLVFSFGGTQNKNLKNYARGHFCTVIITTILLVIFIAGTGLSLLPYY